MVFAVVTGGGTSGHVIPAIAVLEALEDAGYSRSELRYVGALRGIETRLMKSEAVVSEFLPISGLQRSLTPRRLWQNVMLPIRLVRSTLMARSLVKKWQPEVVVSVGGYASEPMARAAKKAGIPLVCVSYDRRPGLATKRQQKYAVCCAVAFADSQLQRAIHTGAPVRRKIRQLDKKRLRNSALQSPSLPITAKVVTIVGGSLGSAVLNNAVGDIMKSISEAGLTDVAVVHICGERFLSTSMPHVPANITYVRHGYVDDMESVYAMSDIVICRAGASTVAEIATIGLCALIVPWKDAAEQHQEMNARWLADEGAAVMLHERDCNGESLGRIVRELLQDDDRRHSIEAAAYALGEIHRSSALVDAIVNASQVKAVGATQ